MGQSLESGSEFGARVWSLDQSLGESLKPEFGARVWTLGSESESRHPKPNPEMSGVEFWVWVWTRVWDRVQGTVQVWGQSLESGSKFGSRQSWWSKSGLELV